MTKLFYVDDVPAGVIKIESDNKIVIELDDRHAEMVRNLISAELATISIRSKSESEWQVIPRLKDYEITKDGRVRNAVTQLPIQIYEASVKPFIRIYLYDRFLGRNAPYRFDIDDLIKRTFR